MKKASCFLFFIISLNTFSQILSPNGDNIFYYNGAADVIFAYPERGSGGRAMVHYPNNILSLNYGSDFKGGTLIGSDVFFKDGGNSYIASGNFGIGTTNPSQKLEVNGSGLFWGAISSSISDEGGGKIELVNPTKTANQIANRWTIYNMTGTYGNSLQFWAYDSLGCTTGGMCNNRFTLMDNGNVGIGTTTPSDKLTVLGSTQIEDNIMLGHMGNTNRITSREVDQTLTIAGSSTTTFETYSNGWSERMRIANNGNVGIGTNKPDSKLTVAGNIHAQEVKVTVNAGADFVFDEKYKLPTLNYVDKFITEHKHLPEIASAAQMQQEGINLSEMNIKLLQKIEELTLYMIEMKKENEKQSEEINTLKSIIKKQL